MSLSSDRRSSLAALARFLKVLLLPAARYSSAAFIGFCVLSRLGSGSGSGLGVETGVGDERLQDQTLLLTGNDGTQDRLGITFGTRMRHV